MLFRQLIDQATSTFTYLLADTATKEAVLIDSVFEQHLRDLALLRELGLTLVSTLETHVHADHVTGAWLMKKATGCQMAVGKAAGVTNADRFLDDGDVVEFGGCSVSVRKTPGHTSGCVTYVLADETMAFTGDALLIRGAGRTDFQEGDAGTLFRSVRRQILSLPDACLLWPGHDYSGRTCTSVLEERENNPRLGDGVREEDFVGYMTNLGLPHPKRMKAAVPANLQSGRPENADDVPTPPGWGPLIRTFAGVWQVEAEWVHTHGAELDLVDVREQIEVDASLMGRVAGSRVIALSDIRDQLDTFSHDKPIVAICPAGARSAFAAMILEKAGFKDVANMRGGMLEWQALGLPVERS